jgi:predicted Zn-dependent protease
MRRWVLVGLLACAFLAPDATAKPRPKAGKAAKVTPEQLVKQGNALIMVGSFEEAAKAYEAALKANPNLTEAKIRLAHCMWRGGKAADAKKLLEAVVGEGGNAPTDALVLLGDIYLGEKDNKRAADILEKLVAQRPSDLKAKMQLADCYRQIAESGTADAKPKALAIYDAIEKAAEDAQLRRSAMEAGLTLRYGEVGKKILVAKETIAAGKEANALRDLNVLAKQHPEIGYLQYLRGMACLAPAVEDRKQARAAFEKAKGNNDAAFQLGVLMYEAGELPKAIKQLAAVTKKDAKHQAAYYHLGLIYQEQGEPKKAMEAWSKAMQVEPDSAIARWAKTKMQVLSGNINGLLPGQVIDPSSEISIGKRTCEMIEARWPVLKDDRLRERLQKIMDKLIVHSDRPKRDLRYRLEIINVPVANALSVPNGKIYFFAGLVDLIRTRMGDKDEYYASVLAHEVAHTALRHGTGMIKMASQQQSFENYWQLAKLMGALSRTHEYEADQYGVLYAYRAGYDPTAGIRLHRKMLQAHGEIPQGMTHPLHKERIERMTDYLLELRGKVRTFQLGVQSLEKKEFDKAVDQFEIFLGVFPENSAARNNLAVALHRKALMNTKAAPIFRRSTDVDPNARVKAISLQSTSDEDKRSARIDKRLLREAVGEYAMVLRKDPRYPQALNNMATALSDLGDLRQARKHLETAIKANARYKEAYNNLGIVLAQQKDLNGAAAQLARAISVDGKYAAAHFNLALVYEQLKKNADAAREWDTYVGLDASSGWAGVARARRAALKL